MWNDCFRFFIKTYQNNFNDISMDEILMLDEKKEKLEDIRKIKMDGVMLRSRCRYEDKGKKKTQNIFLI